MDQTGERPGGIYNAVTKMFSFGAERLREFNLRPKNIAAAVVKRSRLRTIEIHVLPKNGSAVDALVINRDFVIRNIVIDDHLSRTHHNHLPDLLRIEPANVDIS